MSGILQNIKSIFISLANICSILFRGWNIRKVISFSNLLKLLFIYLVSIVITILVEFDTSEGFWSKAIQQRFSDKRMAFYSVRERIGESLLYDRVMKVAKDHGYDYASLRVTESLSHFWLTEHFYYVSASVLNYLLNPKFNLALTHHVNIIPYGYNISYLNMPLDSLYSPGGKFLKRWRHLNDYDAYADLYSFVYGENTILKNLIGSKKIIPVYLAQYKTDYHELPINKALITGTLWGCNRGSLRFRLALKRLAEEDLLVAIGTSDFAYMGKNYLGRAETFGKAIAAMDEQQQKFGIALIIHNMEHMLDGIPTSRIAEAASNGALIIADQNKFLLKFFGDNVLYFNAFGTDLEIYEQIKAHIKWAKENPELAKVKAKKSYEIFQNMTIEKQLEGIFQLL